tara:strand:+ start:3069 stop:3761 length:693 start_codon:yes stop_codon:yes gene_type:complete
MYELSEGDYIRVERSPYVNGHFYLRLRPASGEHELAVLATKTIGFGYDEPYREDSFFLSNPLAVSLRMFNAIREPVANKWVIYHNDYPRNLKFLPNMYHNVTNWFKMSKTTANEINNIYQKRGSKFFRKPFSPVSTNDANNCRSILMDFIRDSLSKTGYLALEDYLGGNPLVKDNIYGNIRFEIEENGDVSIKSSHPCGLSFPSRCCSHVVKPKELAYREPFKMNNDVNT